MKRTKRKKRFKADADWWQKAIRHNVKSRRNDKPLRTRKQKQQDYFASVYDKLKEVEFKDKDGMSTEKHFYMPKLKPNWNISRYKNAVAIYPVLCGRADFQDDTFWVRISRENIGKLAGISPPSVDKGISELMNAAFSIWNDGKFPTDTPLLQRRKWQDGKRRGHEYLPGFFRYDVQGLDPRQWKTQYFIFHTCIVDNGVWAELSRKAKALYWAMRSEAFFDQKGYEHLEGIYIPSLDEIYEDRETYDSDGEPEKREFRNRRWDVCDTPLKDLFGLGRIPYNSTKEIVGELEQAGLVERVLENKSVFKVFLRPVHLLKN